MWNDIVFPILRSSSELMLDSSKAGSEPEKKILESSAKYNLLHTRHKLLIYNKYKNGPKIEPSSTPLLVAVLRGKYLVYVTNGCLSLR